MYVNVSMVLKKHTDETVYDTEATDIFQDTDI